MRHQGRPWLTRGLSLALLAALIGLLSACGGDATAGSANYGGSLNHLHDLLVVRGAPHTVLLASHIGLYRTSNDGASWTEVAGGSGQAMDGLMLYKLAQSPVDAQRLYVLAIPRPDNPKAARAAPGIYTSADAGRSWALASALTAFPASGVYSIGTGAASPGQVFAVIPSLGAAGLYASTDAGSHWHALPTLPTSDPSGVLGDPGHAQHLYLWSVSGGLFTSADDGAHWTPAVGTSGGIFALSIAGRMIYASGGAGLYVSTDGGDTFHLTDAADTFSAVVAAPSAPTHAYALTGTTAFASMDGGATWRPTATTSRHPNVLGVDSASATTAYVGFSYPIGVALTTNSGTNWSALLG
ncbi:MAG: WD40/YVTN/BNR-like repeat-containing protein [Ktedonobacterales bacterium]